MVDKETMKDIEPDKPVEKTNNVIEIISTRRNLIRIGVGIGILGLGYYSYTLLSKQPKPSKKVSIQQTQIPSETESPTEKATEAVSETEKSEKTETPTTPAYYQIYLENGNAKALNVEKNKIDFQSSDHYSVIQDSLNSLPSRNTKLKVSLKGDFTSINTIKIPSLTIFELDGSITLGSNINKILVQETNTITGTNQIEMLGGTYDGNKNSQTVTNYVIDFTKVTNSHFANMVIQNAGKDCFVLDTGCNNNLIENVNGRLAGLGNVSDGNGLDDRGDHNTWNNCIAEDNFSDNWVIKCRNSTFVGCIGRGSIGSVGFGFFADRNITGNQFIACEAYNNKTAGMSLDIPTKAVGLAVEIMNNNIQGIFYNNQEDGIRLEDLSSDGMLQNNNFDILAYNNGRTGFNIEQVRINNNSGTVVAHDNTEHDVYIKGTSNSFNIYQPSGKSINIDATVGNTINKNEISCSEKTDYWSVNKYCNNQ